MEWKTNVKSVPVAEDFFSIGNKQLLRSGISCGRMQDMWVLYVSFGSTVAPRYFVSLVQAVFS
jgi:hypothetical protein